MLSEKTKSKVGKFVVENFSNPTFFIIIVLIGIVSTLFGKYATLVASVSISLLGLLVFLGSSWYEKYSKNNKQWDLD